MNWILGALLITFTVNATTKSSEIPLRREFPVNSALNPCTDFFQYACSKVIDTFQLREDRSYHDFAFSDSQERLLDAKKKYFSELTKTEPQSKHEAQIKSYYIACMNESARAKEEKELVLATQNALVGVSTREEFMQLLAKNRMIGEETPVSFSVTSNQDRPLYNDLILSVGWTTLPEKSYYEKPEVVADLNAVVAGFFEAIGASHPSEKAKVVVDFEKGLAKEKLTPAERMDVYATRTGITKAALLKNYPEFQLSELLDKVPKQTHIRHIYPRAMDYSNTQLAEMPLEDLKTIYLYNVLYELLDDAYPDYFKKKFEFEKKDFGGPSVRPVRPERCTRLVMARFTPELDSILWPKIFPDFPTEKIVALSEKIRGSIIDSLKENKWLSKQARKEAISKIKTANLQLVAPHNDEEWNFNPEAQYDLEKPIQNEKLYSRLGDEKNLSELKGPINPNRWDMGPLTINAYYSRSHNKFVLPVGILQYPFFDAQAPMEINLAAVGSVMGHELGHGIDDKGSRYDSHGVLRGWMTKADTDGFKARTKILVDQFTQAGENGELKLDENIGDLVGLTASHRAAFHGKEPNPELEKAFYTQFARVWCEVIRPKFAELRNKTNPHASGTARTNQQIRQQAPFRQAFQCKDSDAMVLPVEKLVHIW